MQLTVYLAGQIHDNWRDEFRQKAKELNLPIRFEAPMEEHDRSDAIGETILGEQPSPNFKDEMASQMNNLRTRIHLEKSDVVVALFGDKYRQWNTAMDCGIAIALGKPLILVRDKANHHALKEISNRAQVVVETPAQAIQAIQYIFE
ncbi:YtoQ family protein [Xanthovirga aplysinae]|uniref:YtoQ family protein n=1 Tax=Xanthovirga aplysinae TaxID=2529853 RepID=UPI0012BBEC04|nr:YtoQ family protein [Xanthovirga aplysinae]MTI32204.1 YtoQ family protein [Xanthovirga aplysinae]